MPTPVWPYLTSQGFSGIDQGTGAVAEFWPDGQVRIYQMSSTAPMRDTITYVHKHINLSKLATLRAFFAANKYGTFYVYNPAEGVTTSTFDPTGVSATGRHTAVLFQSDGSEPQFNYTNTGRCLYDVEVQMTLLD